MTRRSILARYDASAQLDRRIGQLAPAPNTALTALHVRTVEVLSELLNMAGSVSDDDTPPALRTLLVIVRRSQPMMLDLVSKVPPSAIIATMSKLRDDIQSIIDVGIPDEPAAVIDQAGDVDQLPEGVEDDPGAAAVGSAG